VIQNAETPINQTLILITLETYNRLLYEAAMLADVTVAVTSAVFAA